MPWASQCTLNIRPIEDCGAYFKAGGHRSAAQYFSRARHEHVRPTRVLITKVIRTIERGMGPATLKDALEVEKLAEVFGPRKTVADGESQEVIAPKYLIFLGCRCFTRGIEASAAKRRDVRVNSDREKCKSDTCPPPSPLLLQVGHVSLVFGHQAALHGCQASLDVRWVCVQDEVVWRG